MFEEKYLNVISVDCIIFGFDEEELKVLLVKGKEDASSGKWALPGTFVEPEESLDYTAQRILKELTGLKNIYMDQVRTFGNTDRYSSGRVVSIAYYVLVKINNYKIKANSKIEEAFWYPCSKIPDLVFDHKQILDIALNKLKDKVTFHPVGFELLPEKFTLTQLQNLHERILEKKLDKRNFRKKILGMDLIIKLEESQKGVAHRAARYFKFDQKKYNQLLMQGFNYKI